jgi:hypothetical protein
MDTGTYLCTYVVPIFIYVLFPLFPKMVSGDAAAYIWGTPGYMGTKTPSNYWFAIKAVLQGPQRHPSKHSAMSRLTLLWVLLCLAATAATADSAGKKLFWKKYTGAVKGFGFKPMYTCRINVYLELEQEVCTQVRNCRPR